MQHVNVISEPAIIYVPGIKPKPPAGEHRAALWRCLLEGVRRADPPAAADIARHPACFSLVSWAHVFYDTQRDIALDEPGIERLLALSGPAERDVREAGSWRKRLKRSLYLLSDAVPATFRPGGRSRHARNPRRHPPLFPQRGRCRGEGAPDGGRRAAGSLAGGSPGAALRPQPGLRDRLRRALGVVAPLLGAGESGSVPDHRQPARAELRASSAAGRPGDRAPAIPDQHPALAEPGRGRGDDGARPQPLVGLV